MRRTIHPRAPSCEGVSAPAVFHPGAAGSWPLGVEAGRRFVTEDHLGGTLGPLNYTYTAAEELFVGGLLSPLQIGFLDALGNDDGTYNLGDVLSWIRWYQGGGVVRRMYR